MNNIPTYLVIEIQTQANGTAAVLPIESYANRAEALSAYYAKCALAVISSVPVHTVEVITNRGFVVACECFEHPVVEQTENEEEVVEEEVVEEA